MTSRSAFISSSQRDYTMRPNNLKSRIFLDGGDPAETRDVLKGLGFLDGQTTNPTLIAKNPEAKKRLERGEKFKKEEVLDFYRGVVRELSGLLPQGSISVEVYADQATTAGAMLAQGREMFEWIPNAHVKFPGSREGLRAAEQAVRDGLRVNLTLCFSQEQAAAVYGATRGAKKGDVFISPFIGRLDARPEHLRLARPVARQRDPAQQVDVAQPAGALLDVGLEEIDRGEIVPVFLGPLLEH